MDIQLLRTDNCVSEIMNNYADMVYRLCFVYLKNTADAEDAFQEIFLKLFEKAPGFKSEEHLKAWLLTCTSNHCKNMLRSYWFKKRVSLKEFDIPIRDKEEEQTVKFVMELPLKYRRVIYLFYYEGYSTRDMADILHLNEATIRTQLNRGRELLRKQLQAGGMDHE